MPRLLTDRISDAAARATSLQKVKRVNPAENYLLKVKIPKSTF